MINLIEITSHAELVEKIVGQFAFMALMSESGDSNFFELQDIFRKADAYFVDFTDELGMIMSDEVGLKDKLAEFLKEWEEITDVTAIQQNIHYQLSILDKVA